MRGSIHLPFDASSRILAPTGFPIPRREYFPGVVLDTGVGASFSTPWLDLRPHDSQEISGRKLAADLAREVEVGVYWDSPPTSITFAGIGIVLRRQTRAQGAGGSLDSAAVVTVETTDLNPFLSGSTFAGGFSDRPNVPERFFRYQVAWGTPTPTGPVGRLIIWLAYNEAHFHRLPCWCGARSHEEHGR